MKSFTLNVKHSCFIQFQIREKSKIKDSTSLNDEEIHIKICHIADAYSKLEIKMNSDKFEFIKGDKDTHSEFLSDNGHCYPEERLKQLTLTGKDIIANKKENLASISICGQASKELICNSSFFNQKAENRRLPTRMNRDEAKKIYIEILHFIVDETKLLEQETEIQNKLDKLKLAQASRQLSKEMQEDLSDIGTALSYFIEQCGILKSRDNIQTT